MSISKYKQSSDKSAKITFHPDNKRTLASNEFQKRKFRFINELSCLLFAHKKDRDISVIISKLIIFTLSIHEHHFLDKAYTSAMEQMSSVYEPHEYLRILKKIHILLFQTRCLSEEERLRFYRLERFCIKCYLKKSQLT